MIGNARAGNTSAARTPLLPLAPEEIVAQGKSAVETSNRNIGARLATLHSGGHEPRLAPIHAVGREAHCPIHCGRQPRAFRRSQ